jgi:hypothetical protein
MLATHNLELYCFLLFMIPVSLYFIFTAKSKPIRARTRGFRGISGKFLGWAMLIMSLLYLAARLWLFK